MRPRVYKENGEMSVTHLWRYIAINAMRLIAGTKSRERVRAGVDLDDVRVHDLCHSDASILMNEGACSNKVQKRHGHTSVENTEIYELLAMKAKQRRCI